jgi:hypothetical protein
MDGTCSMHGDALCGSEYRTQTKEQMRNTKHKSISSDWSQVIELRNGNMGITYHKNNNTL